MNILEREVVSSWAKEGMRVLPPGGSSSGRSTSGRRHSRG